MMLVPAVLLLAIADLLGGMRSGLKRGYRFARSTLRELAADSLNMVVPRGSDGRRRIWPRPEDEAPGPGSRKLRIETNYLRSQLRPLARSREPVIAGPFLGEVGFELLYWIPFLRWAAQQRPDLAERLVVTSRGGTRSWYGALATDYVDVLDIVEVDQLAGGTERLKQRGGVTPLEDQVHVGVRERLGIERAAILHPAPLWRTYYRSIKVDERAYVRSLRETAPGEAIVGLNSVYSALEPPEPGPLEHVLPTEDFAAVRFYFRPSFPDTQANRRLARTVIQALAAEMPVVLLNNGMHLDDHRDLDPGLGDNVIDLTPHMTPSNNLEIQSIAVSRASSFVGTYGGLAYLAPHYGVDSVGFVDDEVHCYSWHLELAQALFSNQEWGALSVLSSHDPQAVARAVAGAGLSRVA